ncbi:MAG: hypothetical protein HY293_12245 [Planctomycetes bacterium]|nr:hypothetical protein [Planctomycetota bacterium]
MAIMFIVELPGVGQDKYDAVMKELGLDKAGGTWAKGIRSHSAGAGAGGWTVVDVWDSEADFAAFQQARLGPAFQKVGGLPEPKVTAIPVHFSWSASAAKPKAKAAPKKAAGKKKKKR